MEARTAIWPFEILIDPRSPERENVYPGVG